MEASGLGKSKTKTSCPYGENFYSRVAKMLLSDDPKALDELKETVIMVEKSKLNPTDELWDSGDEFSHEAEAALKAANKVKKAKPVEKEKKEEKAGEEKATASTAESGEMDSES